MKRAAAVLIALILAGCAGGPARVPGEDIFHRAEVQSRKGIEARVAIGGTPAACRIEAVFHNPGERDSGLMTLAVRAFDRDGKLRSIDALYARDMKPGQSRSEIKTDPRICALPPEQRRQITVELY